jgi:hypothetical protein
LVQRERKGNAKARKRGARLKIEKLKTSGLLELTQEALQGKSVRDAVLEKLNAASISTTRRSSRLTTATLDPAAYSKLTQGQKGVQQEPGGEGGSGPAQ